MSTTTMSGPYSLNEATINEKVTRKWPGNYALINAWSHNIKYIGRSDTDVNGALMQHIGPAYSQFKFEYALSSQDAFEKECETFHGFPKSYKIDNRNHPEPPADSGWKCPKCAIFG